jgi:uncharacterized protein YuzE
VRFSDALVVESEEVSDGVVIDYDGDGRIVAIELLDARSISPRALNFLQPRSRWFHQLNGAAENRPYETCRRDGEGAPASTRLG